MSSEPPQHSDLAELFTWHVPLPSTEAGAGLKTARKQAAARALAAMPMDSVDARAVEVITREVTASARVFDDALRTLAADNNPGTLDPLLHAAILQRFAVAVVHQASQGRSGKRARGAFSSATAYEAMCRALSLVDSELQVLSEEAGRRVELPPAVFAELTVTFVRTALAAGDPEAARAAADALEATADEIEEDYVRFHVLTSLALARIADSRPDDAVLPAQRARSVARHSGDLAGVWRAERIRAHAASASGRPQMEEQAHREVAALSRTLADDLATPVALRCEAALAELESRAVLVRLALSQSRFAVAEDHAAGMIDRVRKSRSARDADAGRLWEFEVDARVARMLVTGLVEDELGGRRRAINRPGGGGKRRAEVTNPTSDSTIALLGDEQRSLRYAQRRTEALEAIATAGTAQRDRALWWAAYVEDRHAYVLAARGRTRRALRAAERAHRAWLDLGETTLAERCEHDMQVLRAQLSGSLIEARP